jgi:DNA mismatch endonuclease (patch repair protein)
MTDVHSPEVRSRNMRAIRSSNTKPELFIRKGLHSAGLRYKLHGAGLPGRPDLVFPKFKTVIFVHGCFWHAHECRLFKLPKTRAEFWLRKLGANQSRDQVATKELLGLGWNVIVVWECAIRDKAREPAGTINQILVLLTGRRQGPWVNFIE